MEVKEAYIIKCEHCGNAYKLMIYPSDIEKFKSGQYNIQEVFPYLTPGERELIMSGICGSCFDQLFKNIEE